MVKQFAVGDHVRWNSEAGYVEGVIIKIHTHNVAYKGYVHHATESDPQYEIKSDKTDHIAMHKGGALTKLLESSLESRVWRCASRPVSGVPYGRFSNVR
jgi:Hypervirulence associated proteins TUDOR domain